MNSTLQLIIDKLEKGYNPSRLLPIDLKEYTHKERVEFIMVLIKLDLLRYL